MSVMTVLARFSPLQRIAAMLTVSGILLGALLYGGQPEVAVAPPATQLPGSPAAQTQPQLPKGYVPGQVLRDPFAVPPEYPKSKQPPGPGSDIVERTGIVPTGQGTKAAPPVLMGVVGSEGTWRAIIHYSGESRSYAVNEYAGLYLVQAITLDSVTLHGGGNPLVLTVGGR